MSNDIVRVNVVIFKDEGSYKYRITGYQAGMMVIDYVSGFCNSIALAKNNAQKILSSYDRTCTITDPQWTVMEEYYDIP